MSLVMVFYQDIKERLVYWFLFPVIALCSAILLYNSVLPELFITILLINMVFVLVLLLVVYGYSRFKLKTPIFQTFGFGDALLFFALVFSFSSVSFVILFVFGLVFSLVLHMIMKGKTNHDTVPLAGYLSLFFSMAYIAHWIGLLTSVYSI